MSKPLPHVLGTAVYCTCKYFRNTCSSVKVLVELLGKGRQQAYELNCFQHDMQCISCKAPSQCKIKIGKDEKENKHNKDKLMLQI